MQKIAGWGDQLALMLPYSVAAILVLGVFWLAARIGCGASDRALRRFDANEPARGLISRLLRLAVLLAGVMVALGVLNLDKALASVLAGAGVVCEALPKLHAAVDERTGLGLQKEAS